MDLNSFMFRRMRGSVSSDCPSDLVEIRIDAAGDSVSLADALRLVELWPDIRNALSAQIDRIAELEKEIEELRDTGR